MPDGTDVTGLNYPTEAELANLDIYAWDRSNPLSQFKVQLGSSGTGGAASQPYILPFFFTTALGDGETLLIHVAGAVFVIPANFANALESYVGSNPTSAFTLDIQRNGATIGSIEVGTDGDVTATTVSGTAKAVAAGDLITVIGPATADATAANMAFTILGVR